MWFSGGNNVIYEPMISPQLKLDIESISKQQLILKPQQKTVRFKGTRIIYSRDAQLKREFNTIKLRHLNRVYNILRERPDLNKNTKQYINHRYIDSLLNKYNV